MKQSKEMQNLVDAISSELFGKSKSEALKTDTCVSCGEAAIKFSDALSKKEYKISGLCQCCQDKVFG